MTTPSILIVDDEPDNFDVIETLLPKQGYVLHYASTGAEAISALKIVRPDVILMDVMMPEMDGIEVCQRIKTMTEWQTIPIIMVTALNTKEDLARCLKAGADDFISKPVNSVELRARLHSMLRIKQQYDYIQSLSELQRSTIHLLGNNLHELRGSLVATLPQELNTPLNDISENLKVLLEHLDELEPEKIRQFLKISYQSADHLGKLTQKFINCLSLELAASQKVSRVNSEQDAPPSSKTTAIKQIAENQAQQCNRVQDLECQIETATLAVSETYLQWIVEEILNNAFKFSPPNTRVTVIGQRQDQRFHLQIHDRGRGMTQQQISRIGAFVQFERQTYEQPGMGLGLRIVQKAVELAGGKLTISSVYHQETTVDLTLPLENSKQRAKRLLGGDFETLVLEFEPDTL